MERIKLTKKAISDFIVWSSSRYNDYLNFGNKKENVDRVLNSLKSGCEVHFNGSKNESKTRFEIECSGGNGEGYGNRYWRLKGRSGDYVYVIDCAEKMIIGYPSLQIIMFNK